MSPLPVPAGVHLGRGSFFGAIAAAGAAQTGQPTWVGHALTWGPVAAQAGMTWMGGQAGALASLAVGLTDAGLGALCADAVDLLSQAPNDLQNRLAKAVVGGIAAPLVGSLIGYLGDTPVSHATGLFLLVLGSAAVATRPSFA